MAAAVRSASLPSTRMRQSPEASEKARPNLMPGTVPTRISYRSSTVLMKWLWPKIRLAPSGMISFASFNSMAHLVTGAGIPFRRTVFSGIIILLWGGTSFEEALGERGKGKGDSHQSWLLALFRLFPFSPFPPFLKKIWLSSLAFCLLLAAPGRGRSQDRLISAHDRLGRGHGPDGLGRGAGGASDSSPRCWASRWSWSWWTPGATGSKRPTP